MYPTVLTESGAQGRGRGGKDCFGSLPTEREPGWECPADSQLHPALGASWHRVSQLRSPEYGAGDGDSFSFLSSDPRRAEVGTSKHSPRSELEGGSRQA